MSLTTDAERAADAHERRNEVARARLALAQKVATLSYEGLTVAAMAERLGICQRAVKHWRFVLGWNVGHAGGRHARGCGTLAREAR